MSLNQPIDRHDDASPLARRRFLLGTGLLGSAVLTAGCGGPGPGVNTTLSPNGTSMITGSPTGAAATETAMATDSSTASDTETPPATGTTDPGARTPIDPSSAPQVPIDRFSESAGSLMVRTAENDLPGPNEPIDFDTQPFLTRGLGPAGGTVEYYNFDVQPTIPAPIYVLIREGEETPVEGQLNVIDVIPGGTGYNDFWHVHHVTVPADYEFNTITSLEALRAAEYPMAATEHLVNCPVVPDGSTATSRIGDGEPGLIEGWYRNRIVTYFTFTEAELSATGGSVPVSPIYVAFNTNPDEAGGGPPPGFMTEADGDQTHNVVATLPGDDGYSPLWLVNVYDNAAFDDVSDLKSAQAAAQLEAGVATVNCPIVSVP